MSISPKDIIWFLRECIEKDYELDADDIKHILEYDFAYVRKQHIIESVQHD